MPVSIYPLSIGCALLLFAGCASTVHTQQPELPLPAAWSQTSPAGLARVDADWWKHLGSPRLAALIAEARQANPDLRIAAERVHQAELQLRIAGASRFPTLDLNAGGDWRRTESSGGAATTSKGSSVSLGAAYELDLWGRLRRESDAAEASLRASRYDADAAQLSLEAAVAATWFDIQAQDARLNIARSNLQIAERLLTTVETRQRLGAVSSGDVAVQRTNVLSQQAALLPLEQQRRQSLSALALLLGRAPSTFTVEAEDIRTLTLPDVDAGLPSDLLERRPDLAAAEARLAAADADVGAARAALLPRIQLSAATGLASDALLSLSNPAASLSAAVSLTQNLFDHGRRRTQVQLAESVRRELVESYRKTVLAALKDVEDALALRDSARREEEAQARIVEQAALALRLVEVRYREGADDISALLGAQRTLFQAQDQVLQARRQGLDAALALYKALGGGWSRPRS